MQNSIPNLGYWKIRGLASPIRYFMEYLNVKYEETIYEVTDGPEFDTSCWFNKKFTLGLDFPNLPYLLDGNEKLTETHAILMYLGRKHKPETLGKNTIDSSKVDMVAGVIKDLNSFIIGHCYGSGDKDAIIKGLETRLSPFNKFLENKTYLVGDYLTFVDFLLYELLELIDFISGSISLVNFENLRNLLNNMRNSDFMKTHRESGRFVERPFNNKMAKINN
jgi:glutathione S-transferase